MTEIPAFLTNDASFQHGDMFRKPVPVPANDIDAPDLVCLSLNEDYAPIVAMALQRLTYYDAWEGSDTDIARVTAQFDHLIGQLLEGACLTEPEQPEDTDCIEIGAFHPALEYWPNHPILSPAYKPNGYAEPAWQTGAGQIGLTGADAWLNSASITTPIIITEDWHIGLPSIRLHFTGAGKINFTFVDAVQGGGVWIFPDGNFLLGDFVSLNHIDVTDLADVPTWFFDIIELFQSEPINEVYHEFEFTTGGAHTLTMWFLPLGEEPPFVGFGGGLRSLELCGEIQVVEEQVMPYSLNLVGCDLQLKLDDAVVNTIDLTPCIEAIASPQLRDNSCQLQAYDLEAESWANVPGASYFRREADCPIIGSVEIEHGEAQQATMLNLQNTRNTPGENANLQILWRAYDQAGTIRNIGRMVSGWANKAAGNSQMYFQLWNGTNERVQLGLTKTIAVAAYGDDADARRAFGIIAQSQSYFSNLANMRIFNQAQNRNMFSQFSHGLVELTRAQPLPTDSLDFFRMNAISPNGTPQQGFGGRITFRAQSTTTEEQEQARIVASWDTATHATRAGRLTLWASDYLGDAQGMRITAYDGAPAVGFLGMAPSLRRVHAANTEVAAINEINATLAAFGLVQNNTVVVPDSTSDAQGDRNLPPTSVNEECLAANWIAGELYAHIADAFSVADFTTQSIYDHFRLAHGFDLQDLYVFANNVHAQTSLGGPAILIEIASSYPDLVPAIFANLYNQDALAEWVLSYSGYGAGTLAVFPWLIRAFTETTWLELLYTGSLFGEENFSCSTCEGGPSEGYDWAVEWDYDNGLMSEFSIMSCGSAGLNGWDIEQVCYSGNSYLDITGNPDSGVGGNLQWRRFEVTVVYDTGHAAPNNFTCTINLGGGPIGLGTADLTGTGVHTFALTTSVDVATGAAMIPFIQGPTWTFSGELTIIRIRAEGIGDPPVGAMLAC